MTEKRNLQIREKALKKGVKLWQIADRLGISEVTFIRRLRYELPQEEKEKVLNIIDQIAEEER